LPYLVVQYVAGMSLQERLDHDGPLQLPEVLRIGMQTAAGLAAAHAQGIIHRDVKPANILLENGVERVKLTDFGLARAAADAGLTQSGVVAGTPQYMSPEQAEGKPVDHRSDLFSLGSVLYAMATGRAPFRANGSMAILKRICEQAPTPIREINPEVPDWLVAIIDKLHAKDPAERFQSAAEVSELLGRHLAHLQHPSVVPLPIGVARPESSKGVGENIGESMPFEDSGRATRKRCWAIAAAVLVCLLGGLSLTEATGVTNVRATVIRIFTPEGTLIVETDDPAVKVTVEGDGDLVITGAGAQEVRLRPGSYKVQATKDGKSLKLDRELVTITRGDKQVVRVRLEGEPRAATGAPKAETGAFVVLGGKGVVERKFDTLAEAVVAAGSGDTIEIRGKDRFSRRPSTSPARRSPSGRVLASDRSSASTQKVHNPASMPCCGLPLPWSWKGSNYRYWGSWRSRTGCPQSSAAQVGRSTLPTAACGPSRLWKPSASRFMDRSWLRAIANSSTSGVGP
jgi:hypothetical protein